MICQQCGHDLPDPAPGFCTYCGAPTSPTSGIIVPTGVGPSNTTGKIYYCPWENRAQLGFWKAFIDTLKLLMSQPTEFFQQLPPEGNIGSAIGFGVLAGTIGMIASIIWRIPFQMFQVMMMSHQSSSHDMFPAAFGGMFMLVALAIFSPLLILIGLFISAAITHFALWIVGGANKGFETTLRIISYSSGISVLNIIPLCGGIIAPVWQLVLDIIGLKEVHETTFGKAIAARLLPMVVCCCCVIIGFALIFGSIVGSGGIQSFLEGLNKGMNR